MIPEGSGMGLRIPPHSEEAERGVLGSILLDPSSSIDKCLAKRLKGESFHDRRHQALFDSMVDMSQANVAMDAITIAEWLKTSNTLEKVGGYDYLVELQDSTLVPAHVEYYCEIVQEKHLYRRLIEHSSEVIDSAYRSEEEAALLVSSAEESLFNMGNHGTEKVPDWKESVKDAFTAIENINPNELLTGITTGYIGLNERLSGLQKTDMVVLAARPAMGKTSLALNIAENAALGLHGKPVPVGVFSLEMSREQLQKAEIYIDDTPGLEAVELRSRARRMKRHYGIELIVVDYLQLMNYSKFAKDGRQRETMAISGAIKAMAKELDVPVMVLSQLSRATEGRGDNIPKLSDLRDSGAIEQDADVVMLLYRPSYYQQGDERNQDKRAKVDIAKYRHGETGVVEMIFNNEYTRFEDYDPRDSDYEPAD
jgi:replicative DNA helicase